MKTLLFISLLLLAGFSQIKGAAAKEKEEVDLPTIDNLGEFKEASRTDSATIAREEEAIKLDGLNVAQLKEIRERASKHTFETHVDRLMKLIINSLYKNKEIFLRELISNASDALDKIRLLALTDPKLLETNPELNIRIKADKENKALHILDSGIGMTQQDLIKNLGTIAKSGTAEFLSNATEAMKSEQEYNDMIGQFGVGFYSAFLVADRVVVTSKHNDDQQRIWESDANSYSVAEDQRGDTLKRGTVISLYLKDEAQDFLEEDTLRNLIRKYSQFINFPIYLYTTKTVEEDVPIEEEPKADATKEDKDVTEEEEDAKVEDVSEDESKPKTKKVSKTVNDWELINNSKPIWTRKPAEVSEQEYVDFYKSLTKSSSEKLAHTHFVAEGEVGFRSLLYIPKVQPSESFNRYGTKTDNIKLFVRRVFITDEFNDLMPNYLNFILGIVDSDDLPLNVSRETLQQHKLIKVIKKKLVRKVLDLILKLEKEQYEKFWKEYSTNIKLGIMEDPSNRLRLSKLLRFHSSEGKELTSLADYVSRMKGKQEHIYYVAGASRAELERSPFVERLLKKGYEVLYLVEASDEYSISALPEFDGKKFQNVAKEGFQLPESTKSKKQFEELKASYEPLLKWLNDVALKGKILKAQVSERLTDSPCALVAGMFGWTGNMERLALSNAHQKSDDPQRTYYLNQKKTLEINPRHPLMRKLLELVEANEADDKAQELATTLFRTATLRSGFMLQETAEFAESIEKMLRETLGVSEHEQVDADDDVDDEAEEEQEEEDLDIGENEADVDTTEAQSPVKAEEEEHDEL